MTDLSKKIKESAVGDMYHYIFTHAPNAQFIADVETGEIVECNAHAEILIGRTRDQIIGMHQSELHPKGEEERYRKKFALHVERGHITDFEGEVQHSDGRKIPVMISAQGFELQGRKMILGIFADMTERMLIEEQLKSLNQQMEFVLGATKTGLDIIDSEYNVRYIDPAWKKIYGEPAGRKCYEYFMGAKQVCPGCGITRALATKQPIVTEEILVKENNRPIEVITIPFQNRNGEWLVAEVNVDITGRKQEEKEREQLVAILEATPDFVGYADAKDKHIIYINKAGRRMCGIGVAEDVAKFKIWNVHPEGTNKMLSEEILPIAMRDGSWMGECAFLNIRDKHEIPVLMVLSVHKAPGGEVAVISTISRDITERKKIEDELRREIAGRKKTEEALKDSKERLRVQKDAIEQKNIALREIMEQIGADKYRIKEEVLASVDKVLLPILRKLRVKATRMERRQIDVMENSLEELASSFGRSLANVLGRLTPREVEICGMIRSRLTSKEMSKMLHLSRRSVETHRNNIRKKLGLANRKVNLTSYLQIN